MIGRRTVSLRLRDPVSAGFLEISAVDEENLRQSCHFTNHPGFLCLSSTCLWYGSISCDSITSKKNSTYGRTPPVTAALQPFQRCTHDRRTLRYWIAPILYPNIYMLSYVHHPTNACMASGTPHDSFTADIRIENLPFHPLTAFGRRIKGSGANSFDLRHQILSRLTST